MNEPYAQACSAYLAEYIKEETHGQDTYFGWYHYIDSPDFSTVGVVATAQMLILIKDCRLDVSFDCAPMLQSLLEMQKPDGGWGYRSNILDSAVEPTALSLQALMLWHASLEEHGTAPIEKGISWLLEGRNPAGLWGPIPKEQTRSYLYFSCAALRCLHRLLSLPRSGAAESLRARAQAALKQGCAALLGAFQDSDAQCGWGITKNGRPTVFHTAYTVATLLELYPNYVKKHSVIKSLAFLSDCVERGFLDNTEVLPFPDGIHEFYQDGSRRLEYKHSADVYVLLALLLGRGRDNRPAVLEKCRSYFARAERTNWRYQGYVRSWRLYDIVTLCGKYTDLMRGDEGGAMKRFKIALTFAGESRGLVEEIALLLADSLSKESILYDKFHEAEFARPQLDLYLQRLYRDCSELIVVFLCEQYSQKPWCGIEWRAVRDILNEFHSDNIMYVKACSGDIDRSILPGFYPSQDGYIDADRHTPREIADLILTRFGQLSASAGP